MFSFLKKKHKETKAPANVPIAEVKHLSSLGMSDKDIIKQLKEQGYGFTEIEKAMMQAVKGNVEPAPAGNLVEEMPVEMGSETTAEPPAQPEQAVEPEPQEEPKEEPDVLSRYQEEIPTAGELGGELGQMSAPGIEPEPIAPDVAIEELVEGVVDEKWSDFSKRMERNDSIISELKTEIRIIQNKLERLSRKPNEPEELEEKFEQKLEDLEIRINSLEKAFKQMLPNLTKNIQELTMIAKQKK